MLSMQFQNSSGLFAGDDCSNMPKSSNGREERPRNIAQRGVESAPDQYGQDQNSREHDTVTIRENMIECEHDFDCI